jgi:triosephosphate isomerase
MESAQRKMILGGNWKCNGTVQSIKDLVNDVLNKAKFDSDKIDVIVAPISIHIASVKALLKENVKVAAQNMSGTGNGAFTGEISGEQLKDFDVKWVIIGHSERRWVFGETNDQVHEKVQKAQAYGLNAIICIGEQLEQRESGETNSVLKVQLNAIKDSIKDWSKIVIAYEPVWAIGTGKTATPQVAEETHVYIRSWLKDNVSEDVANATRITYGGSVNAKTAPELISMPNIDGFLVGGASLKPEFNEIIAAMCNDAGVNA